MDGGALVAVGSLWRHSKQFKYLEAGRHSKQFLWIEDPSFSKCFFSELLNSTRYGLKLFHPKPGQRGSFRWYMCLFWVTFLSFLTASLMSPTQCFFPLQLACCFLPNPQNSTFVFNGKFITSCTRQDFCSVGKSYILPTQFRKLN